MWNIIEIALVNFRYVVSKARHFSLLYLANHPALIVTQKLRRNSPYSGLNLKACKLKNHYIRILAQGKHVNTQTWNPSVYRVSEKAITRKRWGKRQQKYYSAKNISLLRQIFSLFCQLIFWIESLLLTKPYDGVFDPVCIYFETNLQKKDIRLINSQTFSDIFWGCGCFFTHSVRPNKYPDNP